MRLKEWSARYRFSVVAGLVLCSIVPLLAFQNCTQPATYDSYEEVLASQAKSEPFVFDSQFDQLAYMSCSELRDGAFDQDVYFSFRAGAYRTGGVLISEDFFARVKKFLVQDQKSILIQSALNNSAQPQMAIRSLKNFQQVFTSDGSPNAGTDYHNFMSELTSQRVVDALFNVTPGDRVRYVQTDEAEGVRMEATIYLGSSSELAESTRQFLTRDGVLALTYTAPEETQGGQTSEILARSPADFGSKTSSATSVFGRGLSLRFSQPAISGLNGQYPTNVLREVTETNLLNRSNTADLAPWSCPASLQFRIVRAADLAASGANCVKSPDPEVLSSELALIRQSLRAEDWYVDLTNRCIIPKKPGPDCYGGITTVQYSMSQACAPNSTTAGCVAMASLCFRTR